MRLDIIQIDSIDFKWGDDINTIKSNLKNQEYFENENQYSTAKTLRVKLSNVWEISCNSCEFSSPHYDRLINDFHIKVGDFGNDIESLIAKLEEQFGKRHSDYIGKNHGSGSVIRNCTWEFDNCKVGISIYGGKRVEYGEENYGMIYFHNTDIRLIHELYSEAVHKKAVKLENDTKGKEIELSIFTLEERQLSTWRMEQSNYPGISLDYISESLNSYYRRKLITSPSYIREKLSDNEICFFRNPVDSSYYISNLWESYPLEEVKSVSWINTLPAKVGGRANISIGDFNINNHHSRPETERLIAKLQEMLNIKIEYRQDYDC